MDFLVDTHILLWSTFDVDRLVPACRSILEDPDHNLYFSTASLWEITIKRSQNKADFQVDPRRLQEGLLRNGYRQLEIKGEHVMSVGALPWIHRDPFDRLLIAQATAEDLILLTADRKVARYTGRIQRV